ncbi:MAG: AAA family ATPase [Planctomycetota bacterium]|nr:AAA family ATPase [Planctomycetota bacterium]MDA1252123.1 AAA family ATPase [Planctomycetota bacterium]
MTARFQTAAQLFDEWRDDLLSGKPPTLYRCREGALAGIQLGPGLVTLFGGPPAAGKTAFTMQLIVDALRLNPELRALVANVEVSTRVLLDRQLSRIGGLPFDRVRMRQLAAADSGRAEAAFEMIESISDRLAFVQAPFDLPNIAAAADAHNAGLLVLDYLQRIKPPGEHGDRRGSVDALMDYLRQFAEAGVAVVAVSSVGRQKDSRGRSSYDGDSLNLASFRESSELEFGADDAFMLTPADSHGISHLRHLKARHSEPQDIDLLFRGRYQQFEPVSESRESAGPLTAAICDLWHQTQAADDDRGRK